MRKLSLALGAFMFAALVAPAFGESLWHDPQGAFTMSVDPASWNVVRDPASTAALLVEPVQAPPAYNCMVDESVFTGEPVNQTQLNTLLRATTREDLDSTFANETLQTMIFSEKQGVTIMRATLTSDPGLPPYVVRALMFASRKDATTSVSGMIQCIGFAPVNKADSASIDAWLESLTFVH